MRAAGLLARSALAAAPAAAGWLAWRLHREQERLHAWRAAAEDAGRRRRG
ncbi:hypothetical protein GTQ99_21825, partial [Kineococcus sp. T13]|nr:hypothetical protein [Kineococcus vitellinus]